MKNIDIKKLLNTTEYSFLNEDKHLGNNIMLLTTGGSHAYGTNVKGSDIDIRGIALSREEELLGLSSFEQFEDKNTDTIIYEFNKVARLLLNCNPNIIEIMGTKEEHIFILSNEGKLLKDNIDIFLSQRVIQSFGGYATAQLRRLQNALARDNYPQIEKENHILNSIINQMNHLKEHYEQFTSDDISLYIDDSSKDDFEKEIFMDISLKHYPLRDFKNIYSEMSNVVKDYNNLNHRNKKKDDLHLNKHAMHLLRLLIMGTEILEGRGINTYRETDREFLLDIRNGKYQNDDGSYSKEYFELVDMYEKKMQYAAKNTNLPTLPDMKKIDELVIEINKRGLRNEII